MSPNSTRPSSCYLFCGPDGGTVVGYEPGDRSAYSLDDRQREILAG